MDVGSSPTEADRKLARAVRDAAIQLCVALNAAGMARLHVDCSVSPYMTRTFSDGSMERTDWNPTVVVKRIQEL